MLKRQEKKSAITSQRRQQILDAAREVLSKKGFDNGTTAEIAQTAGIAEGTIYNYFDSKRDLLIAIFKDSLPNPGLNPPTSEPSALYPIVREQLGYNFENEHMLFLLVSEVQRNPKFGSYFVSTVLDPINQLWKSALDLAISRGEIRAMNTDIAARFLQGLLMGLTLIYKIEGENGYLHKIEIDNLAKEVMDAITKKYLDNGPSLESTLGGGQ
jgi:AcrR family transcriptional regulator